VFQVAASPAAGAIAATSRPSIVAIRYDPGAPAGIASVSVHPNRPA